MSYLHTLPRLLLKLSYTIRLSIVMLSFLLCLLLFELGLPTPGSGSGSLFAIPVGLAAWIFNRRGALISIGGTISVIVVSSSLIARSIIWPPRLIMAFVAGSLALIAEGFIISYLRNSLDVSDTARLKAQQAEQQIAVAYEQQRQLNQLKDQFILNVSHELRTPLTEVHGYLELLREHHWQLDVEMQITFLDNATRGCEELQLLINNILDAIEVGKEAQSAKGEELSVCKEVTAVLEHFGPRKKEEHSIHVDISEELTVWANQQHLRQVLRNLLANAFKYSPIDTPVLISATPGDVAAARENASSPHVCINVKDAGPGIPPTEIPLLFGKFVRLQRDISGPVRGSGLGLYICKQLVEGMGGTIWVESEGIEGQGSRFCFTLPRA